MLEGMIGGVTASLTPTAGSTIKALDLSYGRLVQLLKHVICSLVCSSLSMLLLILIHFLSSSLVLIDFIIFYICHFTVLICFNNTLQAIYSIECYAVLHCTYCSVFVLILNRLLCRRMRKDLSVKRTTPSTDLIYHLITVEYGVFTRMNCFPFQASLKSFHGPVRIG